MFMIMLPREVDGKNATNLPFLLLHLPQQQKIKEVNRGNIAINFFLFEKKNEEEKKGKESDKRGFIVMRETDLMVDA